MDDQDSKKRFKRYLVNRAVIFLGIIAILMYVFGFSWNGFEIKLLVFVFGIMALVSGGFFFFRYLDARNMSVFEYLDETLGADRHRYIWYIAGAICSGLIVTKILIG